MTERELSALRYHILRMCDTEDGKLTPEILNDPSIRDITGRFARVTVMGMVSSLTKTKLLSRVGVSRGSLYFTTPEGREARERFKADIE